METLVLVLVAFGGGVVGACMGALPAFIMTGVLALIGAIVAMIGQTGDILGMIAFGPAFGPHVFFSGAVLAAAYAGKHGHIEEGGNILLSLNGTGEPSVMLIGGLFGIVGMGITLGLSKVGVPTDNIALSVFINGVIGRLVFGTQGVCGTYNHGEKRSYMSAGKPFWYNIILGFCVGVIWGAVVAFIKIKSDMDIGPLFALAFGFSAVSLIFTQTGFATPATHHMSYPAALAATAAIGAGIEPSLAIFVGGVFAAMGAFFGDVAGKVFNSNCDTWIDPPATAIVVVVLVNNLVW